MGNSTVTPAAPATSPAPRTSVSVINPDNTTTRKKSFTSPVPWRSFDDVALLASTTANISVANKISTTSPNPAISVVSPAPVIPIVSPTPTVPIVSTTPVIPVTSPTLAIPLVSPTISLNDVPDKSSNFNLVISPDTSPVPPTINTPTTPIRSITRPIVVTPVNSIISSNEIRSVARITNDASANPNIPVVSTTPVTRKTPLPITAAPKRTLSRTSITPSTVTLEQVKQEKKKPLFYVAQQSQNTDLFTSKWTDSNDNQTMVVAVPHIVALPSFALRTTAVCKPSQDDRILLERTQSTHSNISIFKFYLDQKETKSSIGNHTKATMFKMDTRLKQTPFPSPSLSFFTKNFNDGTHEINTTSTNAPTFQSLGLQNDFEIERLNQLAAKVHSNEQQQRKILHTSSFSDLISNSNNSLQFTSSAIIDQPNYSWMDSIRVQNNSQPLASILKKPSSQILNNPNSTEKYSKVLQEFRKKADLLEKNDLENFQSTLSFNVLPPTAKPGQSIFRSENLFSKR
ncbi:unnamed protein product [Rotaria sp. Silwood2]|nr:unnamed protein product [Rotaria sp. Silwood2]CAF4087911.1 unnamed protein product [Rotaria sp. Silwood2]